MLFMCKIVDTTIVSTQHFYSTKLQSSESNLIQCKPVAEQGQSCPVEHAVDLRSDKLIHKMLLLL